MSTPEANSTSPLNRSGRDIMNVRLESPTCPPSSKTSSTSFCEVIYCEDIPYREIVARMNGRLYYLVLFGVYGRLKQIEYFKVNLTGVCASPGPIIWSRTYSGREGDTLWREIKKNPLPSLALLTL